MGEDAGPVSLDEQFGRVDQHWSPRIIGTLNDYDVKIAKIEGRSRGHRGGADHLRAGAHGRAVSLAAPAPRCQHS